MSLTCHWYFTAMLLGVLYWRHFLASCVLTRWVWIPCILTEFCWIKWFARNKVFGKFLFSCNSTVSLHITYRSQHIHKTTTLYLCVSKWVSEMTVRVATKRKSSHQVTATYEYDNIFDFSSENKYWNKKAPLILLCCNKLNTSSLDYIPLGNPSMQL